MNIQFFLNIKLILLSTVEIILASKLIPTLFVCAYMWFCWQVWIWYSHLASPDASQTATITAIFGLATTMITFYTSSGLNNINWNKISDIRNTTAQRINTKNAKTSHILNEDQK